MAEPRQLTHDGKWKLAPAFKDGGQEVAYAVHETPNWVAIKRLPLAGGSPVLMHPAVPAHQFDPAFSRDGRYHCYAMSAASPQLVLVIQDLKAKTEAIFRPRDSRAVARNPAIAPDTSRVVFTISDFGGQQIASVNWLGQDLRKLTESAGMNACPAFSPDGRHIAFASSREGSLQIYIMDADGNHVRRLTTGPHLNIRPAWSPDGKRIAFTTGRDGHYQIYVMNADGSGLRRVSTNPQRDDYPAWHPDGNHLLTVSEQGGKFDLYLMEVPA